VFEERSSLDDSAHHPWNYLSFSFGRLCWLHFPSGFWSGLHLPCCFIRKIFPLGIVNVLGGSLAPSSLVCGSPFMISRNLHLGLSFLPVYLDGAFIGRTQTLDRPFFPFGFPPPIFKSSGSIAVALSPFLESLFLPGRW